jgi:hypothetical protein
MRDLLFTATAFTSHHTARRSTLHAPSTSYNLIVFTWLALPCLVSLIVHTVSTSDEKYFVTVLGLGVMKCSLLGQGEAKKEREGKLIQDIVEFFPVRLQEDFITAKHSISQHSTF